MEILIQDLKNTISISTIELSSSLIISLLLNNKEYIINILNDSERSSFSYIFLKILLKLEEKSDYNGIYNIINCLIDIKINSQTEVNDGIKVLIKNNQIKYVFNIINSILYDKNKLNLDTIHILSYKILSYLDDMTSNNNTNNTNITSDTVLIKDYYIGLLDIYKKIFSSNETNYSYMLDTSQLKTLVFTLLKKHNQIGIDSCLCKTLLYDIILFYPIRQDLYSFIREVLLFKDSLLLSNEVYDTIYDSIRNKFNTNTNTLSSYSSILTYDDIVNVFLESLIQIYPYNKRLSLCEIGKIINYLEEILLNNVILKENIIKDVFIWIINHPDFGYDVLRRLIFRKSDIYIKRKSILDCIIYELFKSKQMNNLYDLFNKIKTHSIYIDIKMMSVKKEILRELFYYIVENKINIV